MKTREELLTQFKHDLPDYVDPLAGSSPYLPASDLELAIGSADPQLAHEQAKRLEAVIAREMVAAHLRDRRIHSWRGDPKRHSTTTEVEVLR